MPGARVASLTPAEQVAVQDLAAAARRLLGEDLLEIRLFGSRARGEGDADSDVDLALIVTANGRHRRYAVYDAAFDIGLEHGVRLAPLVIAAAVLEQLRSRERLLAADLDREGIAL